MADRPHRALIIHCDGFLMDGPVASEAGANGEEELSFIRTTIDAATCPSLDSFARQGCNGLVALREIPGLSDRPGPESDQTRSLLELAQFLGVYPTVNPKEAGPPQRPASLADRFMKMKGKFLSNSPQALALAHALGFSTCSLNHAVEEDASDLLAVNEVPAWGSSGTLSAVEDAKTRAVAAGQAAADALARATAAGASAASAAASAESARRRAEAAEQEAQGGNPHVAANAARAAADAGMQAEAASREAAAAGQEAAGASAEAMKAAHAALGAYAETDVLSLVVGGGGRRRAAPDRNPLHRAEEGSGGLDTKGEEPLAAGESATEPALFDSPAKPLAAKLLTLLGLDKPLERGPPPTTAVALEDEVDLLWLHLRLGSGHVAAGGWSRAVQAIQWVDLLVQEIMRLSAPGAGTRAEQHLYAVLIFGYGAQDVARGESPGALVLPRGKQGGRPSQSYEMRDGAPVPLLRYHHPALLCRYLPAVTRRDEASKLGVAECMQKGGEVALLADFLLKEIAFKLWRYPKYGA